VKKLTPIEIMTLIIAVFAAIKILVILINPKSWMNVVKTVYGNPILTTIISLVLAVVVLNYLLVELTIVQIFAVMLFLSLLMVIGIAAYSKDILQLASKLLENREVLKKAWLAIIVWVILIVWVLYTLFV
jgi:hypothetical protein